jgi:hypothetical protein
LVFVCLFGVCLFVWSLLASICPSISLINLFTDCVVISPNLLILIHLHTYYEESLMMVGWPLTIYHLLTMACICTHHSRVYRHIVNNICTYIHTYLCK